MADLGMAREQFRQAGDEFGNAAEHLQVVHEVAQSESATVDGVIRTLGELAGQGDQLNFSPKSLSGVSMHRPPPMRNLVTERATEDASFMRSRAPNLMRKHAGLSRYFEVANQIADTLEAVRDKVPRYDETEEFNGLLAEAKETAERLRGKLAEKESMADQARAEALVLRQEAHDEADRL